MGAARNSRPDREGSSAQSRSRSRPSTSVSALYLVDGKAWAVAAIDLFERSPTKPHCKGL